MNLDEITAPELLDIEYLPNRTAVVTFRFGSHVVSRIVELPDRALLFRGDFSKGKAYRAFDIVRRSDGSLWKRIAKESSRGKILGWEEIASPESAEALFAQDGSMKFAETFEAQEALN